MIFNLNEKNILHTNAVNAVGIFSSEDEFKFDL